MSGFAFLDDPAVRRVFDALDREGDESRVVGGAVRDALMGRALGDIDFATTAVPDVVEARALAAGLKVVPTGREHGTLTLVANGRPFEVTTLRQDIETDGRRAVVRFGRDWRADAERRDFTMNALSVDAAGRLHDPVGGQEDAKAGRVRFIGAADRRIAEDRLRLLRFFRFHAQLGRGAPDATALSAAIRARDGLRELSGERLGQEMRKLVVAPYAAETLAIMQEGGILGVLLAGVGLAMRFARLATLEQRRHLAPDFSRRLVALGCFVTEDVLRISARLRLSNAERNRMLSTLAASSVMAGVSDIRALRAAAYRLGSEAFLDGLLLAGASSQPPAGLAAGLDLAQSWQPPAFPLSGRDLTGAGLAPGPEIGRRLKALEDWWIAEDFRPDAVQLRARIAQDLTRNAEAG